MRRALLLLLLLGCDTRTVRRRDTASSYWDTTRVVVSDSATSKDYVERVLEAQLGNKPQLGWFVPPDRFLGATRHPEVFVLSGAPTIERFPFAALLDRAERARVSKESFVACDAGDTLSEYLGKAVGEPSRGLYTARAFAGRVTVGPWRVTLSDAALVRARAFLMMGLQPAAFYRDTAVGIAPHLPVYSFHLAYDSTVRSSAWETWWSAAAGRPRSWRPSRNC